MSDTQNTLTEQTQPLSTAKVIELTDKSDYERLMTAADRLATMGWRVAAGGCCQSCNWGILDREGIDSPAINFNEQSLDGAFGELALPPEWQARFDALDPSDGEAMDALVDEAEEAGAWSRPEMLSNSLWIAWSGTAKDVREAVRILREEGLDATWDDGDDGHCIEVPSVGVGIRKP